MHCNAQKSAIFAKNSAATNVNILSVLSYAQRLVIGSPVTSHARSFFLVNMNAEDSAESNVLLYAEHVIQPIMFSKP